MELERANGQARGAIALPSRPQPIHSSGGRRWQPIRLVSNHFQVSLDKGVHIFTFYLSFEPLLESDSRNLRQILVENVRAELSADIGFFILTGNTIYGTQKPTFEKSSYRTQCEGTTYMMTLSLSREFTLGGGAEGNDGRTGAPNSTFKFLNVLIKSYLRQLNYFEFGSSSRYFNRREKEIIQDTNIVALKGFVTSFMNYRDGLFLKIDIASKILRTDTVLSQIRGMELDHSNGRREDVERLIRESLVGTTVLGLYGNYRYWRVDDVDFSKTCESYVFEEETEGPNKRTYNLLSYYRLKYGLEIQDHHQPLLIHRQTKGNRLCYLVPELCVATGVPEDMADKWKAKVANFCIRNPTDRMADIRKLTASLLSSPQAQKQYKNLGIDIKEEPITFEGKHLTLPTLLFGNGERMSSNLSNFKRPFYEDGGSFSWAIVHFRDFTPANLIKTFRNMSRMFGIDIEMPRLHNLGECFGRRSATDIEDVLLRRLEKQIEIVVIVLPGQIKSAYKSIKRICYLDLGLLSQVIMANTLHKKGYEPICSKLLQQIAAKRGSKLWIVERPIALPSKLMLVGANICNDKSEGGRVVIGFCATMDPTFSRYYSRVVFQKRSKEIIENVRILFKEAILEWFAQNRDIPEAIIFFRDGVTETQECTLLSLEVPQIFEAFADMASEYKPKLAVVVIDKRITQKFFATDQGTLINPPQGTLVDRIIVSKGYDFYMVSQDVKRGTATPTHYRIIYDNTDIPQEIMQELIYSQCYAYWNWSGSIRVPAPVQYANKLSLFVGQTLNEDPRKELRKKLYYL